MNGLDIFQSSLSKRQTGDMVGVGVRKESDLSTLSSSRSSSVTYSEQNEADEDTSISPLSPNYYQDPSITHSICNLPRPTLSSAYYRESDASEFKLRSKSYMKTQKKEVTSSHGSMFSLICMDLYELPSQGACTHVASRAWNRVFQASKRGDNEWTFVVNFIIPGPPYLSLIAYFKGDRDDIQYGSTAFSRIAKKFFFGEDDQYRNNRFKVVPRILEGNLFIQMAVQDTPTLLGNKLTQTYYKTDHYFEIDIDVATSTIARNIVGMMKDASKHLVIDLGFVLQGEKEEELPEVLMCGCTILYIDTKTAKKIM